MTKTEAQTRAELIDSQLAQSGWNVKDPTQVILEGCQRAGLFDVIAQEGGSS